ncbi:proteasome-type protease [Spirulina major]|uniref:proteasome-type protease n=1 Tax=Spirulina major TaxID=270636 RepID=UPI0009341607|nr:proteasome-type protease [Spirulina major]
MTYCLGVINRSGLVIAADSRTNAGVDYISAYRKLFDFSLPGERAVILCTSGNLAVTQSILTIIEREIKEGFAVNLHTQKTLYDTACYIGDKIRQVQDRDRTWLERDGIDFQCNFLVGGQIKGEAPQLYLVYAQGNCIQATPETPFLQIGETKYGKPILDRTLRFETDLDAVAKCALLSIDSTMKSNLSVGPPINLIMYERDTFTVRHRLQLRLGSPYLAKMRKLWEESLRHAFLTMPNLEWDMDDNADDILID